jgi:hypothetical protein
LSYQSAVLILKWNGGGFLPASAESLSRYLAHYAGSLAVSTLQQRMAALAQWHIEHGFPDPTKLPVVRKVLKGIRTLHPVQEKRARPLQFELMRQLAAWLDEPIARSAEASDQAARMRHHRHKAWFSWR